MDINKVKLGEGKIFTLKLYNFKEKFKRLVFQGLRLGAGIRQAFCFAPLRVGKHPVPIQAQDNSKRVLLLPFDW